MNLDTLSLFKTTQPKKKQNCTFRNEQLQVPTFQITSEETMAPAA